MPFIRTIKKNKIILDVDREFLSCPQKVLSIISNLDKQYCKNCMTKDTCYTYENWYVAKNIASKQSYDRLNHLLRIVDAKGLISELPAAEIIKMLKNIDNLFR